MPLLKKTFLVLVCTILAGILVLGIISYHYNKTFEAGSGPVKHMLDVMNETDRTQSLLPAFDPGKLLAQVRVLKRLTLDNPLQQSRIDSLTVLITKKKSLDRSRDLLAEIRQEENRLLFISEDASTRNRNAAIRVFVLLLIAILVLLIALLLLILYNFRRRKTAEKKLSESEEQCRLLIQHVKDYAIFMVDPEGRVMSWNAGAEQIKGYIEAEVIGKPISIFYTDEENQRGEPAYNLRRALEDGGFESIGWRKRKDGSLFYADVVFTPLYSYKGELRGFAKITRDITGQKRTEEEIGNALTRAKELNEVKSRFVSLASHEFKTPLSVILSSVSLIGKYQGPEMEERKMKQVHRIKSHVNNLKQILNDFLSIEKLEGGLIRNSPGELDLPEFLAEIIADMNESCKTGQEIVLTVRGNPVKPMLDDHLLRNILNNLLSNAIKYSPECSQIGLTILFETGTVSIAIKDSGIGIPAGEQEHLFERFFRATNTSGISGTGLGLSIVKKYLELMGGSIHLRSSSDAGSEFTIVLPLTAVGEHVVIHRNADIHPNAEIYHIADMHHNEG